MKQFSLAVVCLLQMSSVVWAADGDQYESCSEALKENDYKTGKYYLKVGNNILDVTCGFKGNEVKTTISHKDSGKRFNISGFEQVGSYAKQLDYVQDFASIVKVVDMSIRCQQLVDVTCNNSWITNYSWLTNREKKRMSYWAGGPSNGTGCACGVTKSCVDPKDLCNCDYYFYDSKVRSDTGMVTRKSDLPITSFHTGDTGNPTFAEYKNITVGDLECFSVMDYESCSEALKENNYKMGKYYLKVGKNTLEVICERKGNEIKTAISHKDSGKRFDISGFHITGSYVKQLDYVQDFASIVKVVDRSTRCQQLVDVICYHSWITNYSWLTNREKKRMTYWAGGPSNGTGCACGITKSCADPTELCNCDKHDSKKRSDTGMVTRKSDLPITSFQTGDTGAPGIIEYKNITIGALECFSVMDYESCSEALKENNYKMGKYYLKVGKNTLEVICERKGNEIKTAISHKDSGKRFDISGFQVKGSYVKQLDYVQDFASIVKVVDRSTRCQQLVDVICYHSWITDYSWLTNREKKRMTYWAGGPSNGTGCACGITKSCADPTELCNCDKHDSKKRSDTGMVTRKSDLPITSFQTGDTGAPGIIEYKNITIGALECFSDTDECSSSSINNCSAHATCTNTVGSYYCTCKYGYSGDGFTCADVDECALGTHSCSSNPLCTNMVGGYSCHCNLGYFGNGITCEDGDNRVICDENWMAIYLDQRLIVQYGARITLRDIKCVVTKSNPENRYGYSTEFDKCGTTKKETSTHIVYENEVVWLTGESGILTRSNERRIAFRCSFARHLNAKEVSFTPNANQITGVEAGYGNFTISISMSKTSDFTSPIKRFPYPVELNQTLYFQVKVGTNDPDIVVLVEKCHATPTMDINSATRYYLIKDRCGADPTLALLSSKDPHQMQFSLKSFAFIKNSNQVYVHCQVFMCHKLSSDARCTTGCQGNTIRRLKRSLSSNSASTSQNEAVTLVKRSLDDSHFVKLIRKRDVQPKNYPPSKTYSLNIGPFSGAKESSEEKGEAKRSEQTFNIMHYLMIGMGIFTLAVATLAIVSVMNWKGKRTGNYRCKDKNEEKNACPI